MPDEAIQTPSATAPGPQAPAPDPKATPPAGQASQPIESPPVQPGSTGNTKAAKDAAPVLTGVADAPAEPAAGAEPPKDAPPPAVADVSGWIPEGYRATEAELAYFADVAAAGVGPEQGKALALLHVKHGQALMEARRQEIAKAKDGFAREIRADPDFGGHRLDETLHCANSALMRYGPDVAPLLKALDVDGHPALIRFLARIGKRDQEGRSPVDVRPPRGSDTPKPLEDVFEGLLAKKPAV